MVNILPLSEYNKTAVFVVDALQLHAKLTDADANFRRLLEDAINHYRALGATIVHVFSKAEQDSRTYKGPDSLKKAGIHPLVDILGHEVVVYKNGPTFSGASGANSYANDLAYPNHLPPFDEGVVIGHPTLTTLDDLAEKNPRSRIIAYTGLTISPSKSHPFRNLPKCTERPAWIPEGEWKSRDWAAELASEDITPQNLAGHRVQLRPLSNILPHPRPTGLERLAERIAKRLAL